MTDGKKFRIRDIARTVGISAMLSGSIMFEEAIIRGISFRPALFCAPLAGITHSAFRRLVAEFGGCGAFWTEMLSAKQILNEDLRGSPYLRRRPIEGKVIYQLMICDSDRLDRVIGRLSEIAPDGIDINLACHAPTIRRLDAGSRLFENLPVLSSVLKTVRACWPGLLTAKIRLGLSHDTPEWKDRFVERMRLFEDSGVDAVVLHPRFFEDKFKRRARHELLAWAASLTHLPLIANGDIDGPNALQQDPEVFKPACALMIGRMAVTRPWVFASWDRPLEVDHAQVWRRLFDYIREDFKPEIAISRIKIFTEYYARNFQFGHSFYTSVYNAPTLEIARERADAFFGTSPALNPEPSLMGL
jgi:tRNA-dihydrouridine synthase B